LPRSSLPSRFGPEIVRRLDQALGDVPELLAFEPDVEPVEASWSFDPPAADRRAIDAVLDRLLEQVLDQLRPRQFGVRQLLCSLRTAGERVPVLVSLLRPSGSHRHVMELVRLHFERVRVPAEVSDITVRAAAVAPLEFRQAQIFDAES